MIASAAIGLALCMLLGASPELACASLGGTTASVSADANVLGAVSSTAAASGVQTEAASSEAAVQSYNLRSSTGEKYTYSEFTTDSNSRVREFLTPDGKVFGIAWQGRRVPNLQVLLGSYFGDWHDAVASQPHQGLHSSSIQTSSLVVQMAGHMGLIVGRAWAPKLVPAGVDARNVVK